MNETPVSLADQSLAELGGRRSVLARQRRDHIDLDELLGRIRRTTGSTRQDLLTDLCRLVFPHAFAEEAVLWPIVRQTLPDGDELTLRIEQEHQQINELFTSLEQTSPGDGRHEELFERITTLLSEDVRDEEDVLLPRLQQALDADTLRTLGWMWEVARRTAPTRPHPVVSRRLPGNGFAALPLTILDRSRDRLDQLSRRVPATMAASCRGASRVLATIAGSIERLPLLRRGEKPSTRE